MPKIYNTPGSEGDRPEKAGSRQTMIVVAVIIVLLILFLLYRFARGAEYLSAPSEQATVSAVMSAGDAVTRT